MKKEGKFTTSVYRKRTFSRIHTHFYSFLPSAYKIGMIPTLPYRCFRICSDQTKVHLVKLMNVFKNNGYPENSIYDCFKTFLYKNHRIQRNLCFQSFLTLDHYHCKLSQVRKSLLGILNCCKSQIALKCQNKLANAFDLKHHIPNLHLVLFINFSVDSAMNPIMVNVSDTLM